MNKQDFLKLTGVLSRRADYLPVAFMLRTGYACAGYYNTDLNRELADTCVLFNARLIEFQNPTAASRSDTVQDFNDFLEEIVRRYYQQDENLPAETEAQALGKTIPLAGIPFDEIVLVYPVVHISALMHRAQEELSLRVPSFLDFRNRSIVVKVLNTKLW
jgi:hypothetical protein